MKTPIYEKDYGIDLIKKIKNPKLKKFYQQYGLERGTYLLSKYQMEVLGDDAVWYCEYHDNFGYEEREEILLRDFAFFTNERQYIHFKEGEKDIRDYGRFVL